jgi:hypothetical protein
VALAALKASIAPGPPAVKSEAALRMAAPLLEEPVADRRNWTIPRLRVEIEAREGVRISRSQLSKALRKKRMARSVCKGLCRDRRLISRFCASSSANGGHVGWD